MADTEPILNVEIALANDSLRRALDSMSGNAAYALLGRVYGVAVSRFCFRGSLEEAARQFLGMPGIRVEVAEQLDRYRITKQS